MDSSRIRRLERCAIIAIAAASMTGCSREEEFEFAPVSGQVTMDGNPLPGVSVTYEPMGDGDSNPGTGSFGKTDQDGRYELEVMTTGESGAVVGRHRVRITTPQPEDAASSDLNTFVERIPPRYNFETTLTEDVPSGGTDSANFALTSQKNDAKSH